MVVAAYRISPWLYLILASVGVFYCLAGKTLICEVRDVFRAADRSLEEGRKQVSRIVGRDTAQLTDQEVRTAALETLAENLSDGVIAPLCWYLIGGLPGMMAYKMINTLDSMIGYRNERYRLFGTWAARMDDVANYLPARLTASPADGSPDGIGFRSACTHRFCLPVWKRTCQSQLGLSGGSFSRYSRLPFRWTT